MLFNKGLILIYKKFSNKRIRKYIEVFITKREKGFPYSKTVRQIYYEVYGIKIGYGSYGGCFDARNIPANVSFGNYCSVARNVKIFRANHPTNTFTSHPIIYNPVMGFVKKDNLYRPPLTIGNDVWIGSNVIILPAVKSIGNGAIIGLTVYRAGY